MESKLKNPSTPQKNKIISNQKSYKPNNTNNTNILPGDRKRLPDESLNSTHVFIDAGFLDNISKYLGNGKYLKFDREKFSQNLAKKHNLSCSKIFYYTAPPFQSTITTKQENTRKEGYDKFTRKLKQKNIIVREGRCQRLKIGNNFEYHQKAVDILLAMDLMDTISNKNINKIILLTSDSDFVPIIKKLEENKIKTILHTFYRKKRNVMFSRSNHLIKSVHKYVLLSKKDFENSPL